ncbi:MAG: phosphatase PAP2 family protein, partial [Myxococcota bacterium]
HTGARFAAGLGVASFGFLLSPLVLASSSEQIFDVDLAIDGTAAIALFSTALLIDGNKHRWSGLSACAGDRRSPTLQEREAFDRMADGDGLCSAAELPRFDRWSLMSPWRGASGVSDVLLYSLMAGPIAFSAVDIAAAGAGGQRIGDDLAVVGQTLGATYLATVVLKLAVSRPRPLAHSASFGKFVRFSGDARLSFPSGHASMSFASASVLSVMLAERFGRSSGAVIGISAAYATAATVAIARVLAQKHFLSDVLVGAALGTALGLTIPLLHTKTRAPSDGRASSRPVIGIGGVF